MSFVSDFEPRSLWSHFDKILTIPRGSGKEERIRRHVVAVAEARGLEARVDAAGNVVVLKPGSPGREGAPATVVQAHLDMVQEKNSDVAFDFAEQAIRPERAGDYLKAAGTTLGADNGIGVAAMLALIDAEDLVHGPLELLFTIDEETGLTGAQNLASDLLQGRRLLNVDSEEEGVLTIGCAGGADSHLELAVGREPVPAGASGLSVRLAGLKGGHSGIDIHLQRGNAVRLLARALHAASLAHDLRLVALHGGSAHNAIPREAAATIALTGAAGAAREAIAAELEAIREEFRPAEPELRFEIGEAATDGTVWPAEATRRALALLVGLPHGVEAMSYEISGLVHTSTNEAVVREDEGVLSVLMSTRSSEASALAALRRRIRAVADLAGAKVEEANGYPGWKPDVSSPLLELLKAVHRDVIGREAQVGAVHAGLECGIIGEKYPGMDMISFGPQIEFPHSPDERVKIDTVGRFWSMLTATLERLA